MRVRVKVEKREVEARRWRKEDRSLDNRGI